MTAAPEGLGRPRNLKPSPAQLRRRRDATAKLYLEGYARAQIARALGVHVATVGGDLELVPGLLDARRRMTKMPDPPPVDWVTDPEPVIGPAYQRTGPLPRLEATLTAMREMNAVNRFAFNVREAAAAGDEQWFTQAQITLADLNAYVTQLQAVVEDRETRRGAVTVTARDDLAAVPLRAGTGVIPTRVHAAVWQRVFAGLPMDEAGLGEIARGQGTSVKRVRIAFREMKAGGVI